MEIQNSRDVSPMVRTLDEASFRDSLLALSAALTAAESPGEQHPIENRETTLARP